MNINEMYKAINKGVPNYIPIEISIKTLIEQCADDAEQLRCEFALITQLYKDAIIKTNSFTKSKESFLTHLRTSTSYQTAQTDLYISPTTYLQRLKQILNVADPSVNFNDLALRQKLMDRVEVLKNITTIEELKREFPEIHKDYLLSLDAYPRIKSFEEKHRGTEDQHIKATLDRQYRTYQVYGLDTRFKVFIQKQSQMYRNMVVRRQFIEGYANSHQIDLTMFIGLNKEKFELYMADKYLTIALTTDDPRVKQECVYYLSTYIRETKFTPILIKNDNGEQIGFRKLTTRYKRLFKQNPELRPIDEDRSVYEGYHIRHVENHVKKYFLNGVSWRIVPKGSIDTEFDDNVISALNRVYNYLSPAEREQRIKEKYAIYERKIKFFESTGYTYRVYGIDNFNGYIAFIYPNGEVLLEKFFDDYANCIPTENEAIYNLKAADFEKLSKLSKIALIKERKCIRIIHRGPWEERAQEIIDRPKTEQSEEEVQQLIKRITQPKQ